MSTENQEEGNPFEGLNLDNITPVVENAEKSEADNKVVETKKEVVVDNEKPDNVITDLAEKTVVVDTEKIKSELEVEYQEKYKDYDTLKQREKSLIEENETLKNRFNEIAPKTEKYYKLSKLAETDPDKLPFFEQLLSGTMTEKEILKAKIIEEKGISDERKLNAILNREYGFGLTPLEPLDPEIDSEEDVAQREREIAQREEDISYFEAQREQDAKKFKESKEAVLSTIEYPKGKTAEDFQKEHESYLDTWKPLFTENISATKEFELNILDEKGNAIPYLKVEIPEKELPEYLKYAASIIGNAKIDATKENAEQVKELMVKEYYWKNKDRILTDAINKGRKETNDTWRKSTFNSDLEKNKHTEVTEQKSDESGQDALLKHINGEY